MRSDVRAVNATLNKEKYEFPGCAFFLCPRGMQDFNICKGFAGWSCYRTQQEGKCRYGYTIIKTIEDRKGSEQK